MGQSKMTEYPKIQIGDHELRVPKHKSFTMAFKYLGYAIRWKNNAQDPKLALLKMVSESKFHAQAKLGRS